MIAMATPTTDQIRNQIDSGNTGEKVEFSDPAAAPLGTDAEAGGQAPTAAERRMEVKAQPKLRHRRDSAGIPMYGGFVAAASVLVLGAAWLGSL